MLLASKSSKKGYWIESLKKHVYSLEEINYFLYNHIDLVYRDFFCPELFDFMENELGAVNMANELRKIAEANGSVQEFVKYVLNNSFYYNSHELGDISVFVSNLDNMSASDRLKIQGDAHCKAGHFDSAVKCYLEILKNMDDESSSQAFYARVAYSVGTIYAKQFMSKNANTYFNLAYELYPDPAYAKACIYMSILANDEEEMLSSIIKYKMSDDALETIQNRVSALQREIENSDETNEFMKMFSDEKNAEIIIENWIRQYYLMLR